MYPRSNGKAEAGVKLAKNTLRKTMSCGGDVQLALLELRNTPRQDAGMSPDKMMTHSLLPTAVATEDNETVKVKKAKSRQSVKKDHDKTAQSLEEPHEGQPIYYKPFPEARWKRGVIHKKLLEEISYIVKDTNGNTYRRNRVHIRRSTSHPDVTTSMPGELREAKEENTCCNNRPEYVYDPCEQVAVTKRTAVTTPVTGARSSRNANSAVLSIWPNTFCVQHHVKNCTSVKLFSGSKGNTLNLSLSKMHTIKKYMRLIVKLNPNFVVTTI